MSQPVEAFRNAFKIPELRQRILFTLGILAVYRLGTFVATPGVNGHALLEGTGTMGGFLGLYDLFSGGGLRRATVFALGIMPYITASIIMSLLTAVIPSLEKLAKEGREGQKKITEYTRYGTVALCVFQSIGIALMLQNSSANSPSPFVMNPGIGFILMCIISFTTGTAFIMWLGEQISEYGVGNGMSLIIFVSIVSRMPSAINRLIRYVGAHEYNVMQVGVLLILLVVVVAGAILVTTGQRRVPVQYPRQVKGRKMYGGQRNYFPLRVNQAGVIPIIFAQSLLMLPVMLGEAVKHPLAQIIFVDLFGYGRPLNYVALVGLIVFFTYFYTAITFNPIQIADDMKKYGGVIMGVRPGKATADYLNKVMTRITLVGAAFLALVALLPALVNVSLNIGDQLITSFFGGTSLLILVGVALDTVRQIEQHLIMHHYDGFAKGRRIRSRRR